MEAFGVRIASGPDMLGQTFTYVVSTQRPSEYGGYWLAYTAGNFRRYATVAALVALAVRWLPAWALKPLRGYLSERFAFIRVPALIPVRALPAGE